MKMKVVEKMIWNEIKRMRWDTEQMILKYNSRGDSKSILLEVMNGPHCSHSHKKNLNYFQMKTKKSLKIECKWTDGRKEHDKGEIKKKVQWQNHNTGSQSQRWNKSKEDGGTKDEHIQTWSDPDKEDAHPSVQNGGLREKEGMWFARPKCPPHRPIG